MGRIALGIFLLVLIYVVSLVAYHYDASPALIGTLVIGGGLPSLWCLVTGRIKH